MSGVVRVPVPMSAAAITTRVFATMDWVPPPSMSYARRVSSASWRCGDSADSGSSTMDERGGEVPHERVLASMRLFADRVMPRLD
jgi:hypothetical protein